MAFSIKERLSIKDWRSREHGARRRRPGERRGEAVSPLKAFPILVVSVTLALLAALIISYVGYYLHFFVPPVEIIAKLLFLWIKVVIGVLIAVVIPFVLGRLVDRWGWLLGFAYSLMYVFFILRWISWSFRSGGPWFVTGKPFIAILLIIVPLSTLVAWASPRVLKKRKRFPMHVAKPLASIIPVVVISVVISALAGTLIYQAKVEKAEVLSFPDYHFRITKPEGWYSYELFTFYDHPHTSRGYIGENVKAKFEMRASKAIFKQGSARVTTYIYQEMPFTGKPVSEFSSRDELYEHLKKSVEDLPYVSPTRSSHVIRTHWYGHIEVDGVDGVRFYYKEGYPDNVESVDPYEGDVFVYKEPYLYCLRFEFHSVVPRDKPRELFNEIIDSFKFI